MTRYQYSPTTIISILDHFRRRSAATSRVVGTLLGWRDHNTDIVHVSECFLVPHSEEPHLVVNMDYHNRMFELQKDINSQLEVVGWYSTFPKLDSATSDIHDVFAKQVTDADIAPLLLVVDTSLADSTLGIKLWIREGKKFVPGEAILQATDAEKLAIDTLIKGKPEGDAFDAPAPMVSESESLEQSLADLLGNLDDVCDHVDNVVAGVEKGDDHVLRQIVDALDRVPSLDEGDFASMFKRTQQDYMMIAYLSNLTRTQLQIADKISHTL